MDELDSALRKEARLFEVLLEQRPEDVAYGYWVNNGMRITPAVYRGASFPDLYEFLRDEFGPYTYDIMIRRNRTMTATARIHLAPKINHFPRKDIRAEIQRLRNKDSAKKSKSGKRFRNR